MGQIEEGQEGGTGDEVLLLSVHVVCVIFEWLYGQCFDGADRNRR